MGNIKICACLLWLTVILTAVFNPAMSKKHVKITKEDFDRGTGLSLTPTVFHPNNMIMMPDEDPRLNLLRQSEVYNARRWPNATIPYTVESAFTKSDRAAIARGLCEIEFQSCVKFISILPGDARYPNYVSFKYNNKNQCNSFVGQIGGGQALNLPTYGTGCFDTFGTVMHEMLHAIGFWHEQQRAIRVDYVRVLNKKDITDPANYGIKTGEHASDAGNFAYDFASIMHYDESACILEVIDPNNADKIRGALSLSQTDISRLNIWNNCGTRRTRMMPCDNTVAT